MLQQHVLGDTGHRFLHQDQVRPHIHDTLHVVLQKLSLLKGNDRAVLHERNSRGQWEGPDLQHDGVDGGELGLFPVQIFYRALQQQNFGVLDVRVHLKADTREGSGWAHAAIVNDEQIIRSESYLLVGDALSAHKTIDDRRVKLSSSWNLKQS